jgi:hypothetical protein
MRAPLLRHQQDEKGIFGDKDLVTASPVHEVAADKKVVNTLSILRSRLENAMNPSCR